VFQRNFLDVSDLKNLAAALATFNKSKRFIARQRQLLRQGHVRAMTSDCWALSVFANNNNPISAQLVAKD